MIAARHLENAPVKEALIDLQVVLPQDFQENLLESCVDKISGDYPKKEEIRSGKLGIQLEKGSLISSEIEQGLLGYRCASEDGIQVVQFRKNGFTFSRLEHYETWEQMKAEAERLWQVYSDVVKPDRIIRVATRYINVLRIPLPISDFRRYLVAPPEIPEGLPQGIQSFITRVVVNNPDIEARAIITQALETVDDSHAPITLDIDVFVNQIFQGTDTSYWECLENLRTFKNQIFFESITAETAELFQ